MAEFRNIIKPAAAGRPRLACEIRPDGVIAGRTATLKRGQSETVLAFAPVPAGALAPGLKTPNLVDRAAVVTALESALSATNARDRDVTVIVPDACGRVLLLDFDTLPSKRQDAVPVVRFRLRKMVPFDVESAALSYQVMSQRVGQISLLVAVMPAEVLQEYEGAVRDAGYAPGAVLSSTLAAAADLSAERPALLVNQTPTSVTTAVTRGDEMLLHRTMDLPGSGDAREEEMAQAVITTLAWYEDTLRETPDKLHFAGPGGAEAAHQSTWFRLVHPAPPLEDLPLPTGASMVTNVPIGSTAGIAGALA